MRFISYIVHRLVLCSNVSFWTSDIILQAICKFLKLSGNYNVADDLGNSPIVRVGIYKFPKNGFQKCIRRVLTVILVLELPQVGPVWRRNPSQCADDQSCPPFKQTTQSRKTLTTSQQCIRSKFEIVS